MVETKAEVSKDLEKALQALEQAKQRVANEKKKQNEKKRKAENHHKYLMGGIVVKYFPDCYSFDEGELNRILSAALQTRECQQIISKIRAESRESTPTQSIIINTENEGCAQIYHRRWYVRSPRGKFHLHGSPLRFGRRRADVRRTSCALRRVVRQRQAHMGELQSPIGAKEPPLPPSEALLRFVYICVQTKAKVRFLSAHKVYPCAPLTLSTECRCLVWLM